MVAPAAILRGIGRIHLDQRSASFFRVARELLKCQCLLFFAEEARVGNFLPGGEDCKGLKTHIDANGERHTVIVGDAESALRVGEAIIVTSISYSHWSIYFSPQEDKIRSPPKETYPYGILASGGV
jgi:hypothetical protein